MEWISVNDRLPEEGQRVICYPNGITISTFGINHEGDGRKGKFCLNEWSEYWDEIISTEIEVTHWMPLPEPPKTK